MEQQTTKYDRLDDRLQVMYAILPQGLPSIRLVRIEYMMDRMLEISQAMRRLNLDDNGELMLYGKKAEELQELNTGLKTLLRQAHGAVATC